MKNFNKQELRLHLLRASNYDLALAEELYNFIIAKNPKVINNPVYPADDEYKPDGIYYILSPGVALHESIATSREIRSSVAVGVKMGDRSANVLLHDAAGGKKIKLFREDVVDHKFQFFSFKTLGDALSDWDGEDYTDIMRCKLNQDINLGDNEYIPSLAELYLILLNHNAINRALAETQGQPLKIGVTWSSTAYNGYVWVVNLYNGITKRSYMSDKHILRPSLRVEL